MQTTLNAFGSSYVGPFLTIYFNANFSVTSYTLTSSTDTSTPLSSWVALGSTNNGTSWTTIESASVTPSAGAAFTRPVSFYGNAMRFVCLTATCAIADVSFGGAFTAPQASVACSSSGVGLSNGAMTWSGGLGENVTVWFSTPVIPTSLTLTGTGTMLAYEDSGTVLLPQGNVQNHVGSVSALRITCASAAGCTLSQVSLLGLPASRFPAADPSLSATGASLGAGQLAFGTGGRLTLACSSQTPPPPAGG